MELMENFTEHIPLLQGINSNRTRGKGEDEKPEARTAIKKNRRGGGEKKTARKPKF
jgi:hypothetical protein